MPYPLWRPGMRILASRLTAMQPLFVEKLGDTDRASTTTASADPELVLAVEANARYEMNAYIIYSGASTGDITMDFGVPTGSIGSWSTYAPGTTSAADGSTGSSVRYVENNVDAGRTYGTIAAATKQAAHLRGLFVTGSTAGNYAFHWAQATSDATATTVHGESWLSLLRVG